MRKILTALVVLLVLLVVVDRGASALAARTIATELQRSGPLAQRPDVTIGGFPFLTQALRGDYDRIEVQAQRVPAGDDLVLADLTAVLTGVQLSVSSALSAGVKRVPVATIDARARLSFADLARRSGNRTLTVSGAGDQVRVRGSVQILGRMVTADALSTVTLQAGVVVVTAQSFEVGNTAADAVLTRALQGRFDLRVPIGTLPYGLVVTGIAVEPAGIVLLAKARDSVLSAG